MGILHSSLLPLLLAPAFCRAQSTAPVSEEVSWQLGVTTVTATLTLPAGKGPFPAVVFVAGSGPTDRDWNSSLLPGRNGTAPLLAAELAKAGFAVLRYDKRFLGPYGPANLAALGGKVSFRTHREEVESAAAYLRGRNETGGGKLFALTNSEGALHALNCQIEGGCGFSGLVLTAPQGRTSKDLMRWQIGKQVGSMPGAAGIMARYDALIAKFQAGLPFAADPELPAGLNNLVSSFYAGLPFTREFLTADAPSLSSKAGVPQLVLIGKKDIQVDHEIDGALFEKAAVPGMETFYPANANHVLKFEPRPAAQLSAQDGLSYNAAGRKLDQETADKIISWLKSHAEAKKGTVK